MPALLSKISNTEIDRAECRKLVEQTLEQVCAGCTRILILPPDMTRLNSAAGMITDWAWKFLAPQAHVDIMPALGTHLPMTEKEIRHMFGADIPLATFKVHDWRNRLTLAGTIPAEQMLEWSENKMNMTVQVEVNTILYDNYDLILSIGQVVPHEVVGMANYTKNICVGAGGPDIINKSHFLGAVYGMERIMGQIDTPPRKLYNHAVRNFLGDKKICYLLTVMQGPAQNGAVRMKGLFAGYDDDTFTAAARLSQEVNITRLPKRLTKAVVYLDPEEFKSTWLGNKAIYRTRLAMADDGELIVLAPGLRMFGEDPTVDRLIRKYGYRGTPYTLAAVEQDDELQRNLSAAAHLIHGASEGRFRITYCPGPGMSEKNIRQAGFECADITPMIEKYDPQKMQDGYNLMPDGENVFFIRNPALGLWMADNA